MAISVHTNFMLLRLSGLDASQKSLVSSAQSCSRAKKGLLYLFELHLTTEERAQALRARLAASV